MAKLTIEQRIEKGHCVTPVGTVSFPHVFTAQVNKKFRKAEAKYSMDLILDSKEDADYVTLFMKAAIKQATGSEDTKMKFIPIGKPNLQLNGDERDVEKYPEYKDKYFVSFRLNETDGKPLVLDEDSEQIMDKSDFYAGCRAKVNFRPYAYDNESSGVNFYLSIIKKMADGEKMSGAKTGNPEEVFADEDRAEELLD